MIAPPMTFSAEAVMANARMAEDGPIIVWWGQEREEFFAHGELDYGERPRRRLIDRVRRARTWKLAIRVAPPAGVDLKPHNQDICRILGLPYGGDPREGDRATWIPASCRARSAAEAMASAGRVVQMLGALDVGALQIHVEEWMT